MAASLLDFDCPQPFNVNIGEAEAADAIGNTGAVAFAVPYIVPMAADAFGNEVEYPRPHGVLGYE